MASQLILLRAGSAAFGLSVFVASATWQLVLVLFFAAGIGACIWSWRKQLSDRQRWIRMKDRLSGRIAERSERPTYRPATNNVYSMPMPLSQVAQAE